MRPGKSWEMCAVMSWDAGGDVALLGCWALCWVDSCAPLGPNVRAVAG